MDSLELVKIAYKKYKQNVYYDQLNLFQRKRLADFECANDFEEKLKIIASVIDSIKNNSSGYNAILDQYIKKIGFKLLPKTVKTQEDQKKDEIEKSDKQKNKDKRFFNK